MEAEEQIREEKEPLGPLQVDASDASVGVAFIVKQLLDVNVAQQITELAQAATRAPQAATTVAEKFGSKGMSSGMESAAKVLKNPDAFTGEDAASFMGCEK